MACKALQGHDVGSYMKGYVSLMPLKRSHGEELSSHTDFLLWVSFCSPDELSPFFKELDNVKLR